MYRIICKDVHRFYYNLHLLTDNYNINRGYIIILYNWF